jgi:putative addiction module component (TIGR02574 family)
VKGISTSHSDEPSISSVISVLALAFGFTSMNKNPIGGFTMSPTLQSLGIDRLSREQRIALVLDICSTIAAEPGQSLLTDAQRGEIERRIAEDDAKPDDVVPWEQVKAQTLSRLKS